MPKVDVNTETVTRTETKVVEVTEEVKTYTLTLSESDALALLAVCERIGHSVTIAEDGYSSVPAGDESRYVFSSRDNSISVLLRTALDIPRREHSDGVVEGSLRFTKNVTREDFRPTKYPY